MAADVPAARAGGPWNTEAGTGTEMSDVYAEWARVYDYFYPDRAAEVSFWASQAGDRGPCVLDLMCGTAEVSLALALRGFQVVGLDRSCPMLAVASGRRAATAHYSARNLSLVLADALSLGAASGIFDFALVGGNGSFNHLDDREASGALRELGRVLRPGGALGMELVNPYLLKEIYPTRTFGTFRPTPPGVHVEKTSSNRYDPEAALFHIEQETTFEIDGQAGQFGVRFALHVREPGEVRAMLEAAGFIDVRFYGDYDLKPFCRWSSDLLVIASRCLSRVQA